MITSRSNWLTRLIAGACGVALISSDAFASQLPSRAVQLEPLSPEGIDAVTVRNLYGKCGSSVVQAFGIREQNENFYTIDGNADVVIIREAGQRQLNLKSHLSDYNGVACIDTSEGKRLLVWSNCGGSACGDDFAFLVVDPKTLKIEAGDKSGCNSLCASRLLRSNLPLQLDGLKVEQAR